MQENLGVLQRHPILWKTVQIPNPFQYSGKQPTLQNEYRKIRVICVIRVIRDSDNLTIEYLWGIL